MSQPRAAALATVLAALGAAGGRGDPRPGQPAAPAGRPVVTLNFRELDGTLERWVYLAAFSPDGGLVAAGSRDTILVWSVDGGRPVTRMRLPDESRQINLAFTPDGKTLVSAGDLDPKVRFFDVRTGKQARELDYPGGLPPKGWYMPFRAFGPGAAVMAVDAGRGRGGESGIDLVELTTGRVAAQVRGPDLAGTSWMGCDFSPDGKLLAVNGERDAVRTFDTTTGKLVKEYRPADPSTARSGGPGGAARFSPDGRFLAAREYVYTGRSDPPDVPRAVVWGVADGRRYVEASNLGAPGFSADNRYLVVGDVGAGKRFLHDLLTGEDVSIRNPPAGEWRLLGQSRDGKALAFAAPAGPGSGQYRVVLAGTPVLPDPLVGAGPPTPAGLDFLWAGWASDNEFRRAYAGKYLAAHLDAAVGYAGGKLSPVPAADAGRVADLLKRLDDDDPDVRDKASADLAAVAHAFEPLLTAALAAAGPGEVRNRLTAVQRGAREAPPPPALRVALRGLALVERLGTPAAAELLGRLARGAAGARLTDEAAAALGRLGR